MPPRAINASRRYPARVEPMASSATGSLYGLGRIPGAWASPPESVVASANGLPGDDRPDRGAVAFGQVDPFGEVALATVGDVYCDQLLAFVGGDEGGDSAAVGGEDPVGLRAIRQPAQLARLARADAPHPQPLVAAEEQRVAVAGDVFDVGRADALDLRPHLGAVGRHRVDVGVSGGGVAAVAAAEDDAAG